MIKACISAKSVSVLKVMNINYAIRKYKLSKKGKKKTYGTRNSSINFDSTYPNSKIFRLPVVPSNQVSLSLSPYIYLSKKQLPCLKRDYEMIKEKYSLIPITF